MRSSTRWLQIAANISFAKAVMRPKHNGVKVCVSIVAFAGWKKAFVGVTEQMGAKSKAYVVLGMTLNKGEFMTSALNMTMKLKQDVASQAALQNLKNTFGDTVQPLIDAALRKSQIVHFAHVVVIDNQPLLSKLAEIEVRT